MCVEINLTKPLISKFKRHGRTRFIAYEGIHLACFLCGMYGHNHEACPRKAVTTAARDSSQTGEKEDDGLTGANQLVVQKQQATVVDHSATFGSWMLVTRTDNRQRRKSEVGGKARTGRDESHQGRSRFQPLADVQEDHVQGEVTGQKLAPTEVAPERNHTSPAAAQALEKPRSQRRANVIVSERQIENQTGKAKASAAEKGEATSGRQRKSGASRNVAEEEDHVVEVVAS
ncbi:PREDICTED: uncharacterized protein LOC109157116 [Ipomoea nil]|uniref:uncharacterized protein LOC109157116 n=1 Tax=Ipomoea nil TaxID=35883 RepID=UPI000901EF28|nr:PREDICTED: uncharacterized protein LOC109157116 [Ipomoea nil]XP_019160546.1 PREDICTED: uncharacterized protein LOC109157116 [Ipomoea nil]